MNYDDFYQWISEDLEAALEPKFGPLRVSPADVEKLGGQSYRGISIGRLQDEVSVSYDLEKPFGEFAGGQPYVSVLDHVCSQIREGLEQLPTIDPGVLRSYDLLKEHLTLELVGIEKNRDMLKNLPHKEIEDMAVVYRVDLGDSSKGSASALITDTLLSGLGISPDRLHEDALLSAPEVRPLSLKPLFQVLMEMTPFEAELPPPEGPALYVATNTSGERGASVLAYPGFFETAYECVGDRFFILPSSRHEVLLLEDDGSASVSQLKEMVRLINETEVRPEDVLTDNVYHYDGLERIFETAESFEERSAGRSHMEKGSVLQSLSDHRNEAAQKAAPEHRPARQESVL